MKKTLLALFITGVPVASMAQSSVTLYGVANVGVSKLNGQATQMDSDGLMIDAPSRLGVRGAEDIGSGSKVGFNFETGLSLEKGDTMAVGGGFWGRTSVLWIEGAWGTLKMGRSLNPSFFGVAAWEIVNAVTYNLPGAIYSYGGSGPRNSSQFSYRTPALGGFSAELAYVLKPDNGDKSKWDGNVIYTNGPLALGLSAHKTSGDKLGYVIGSKYNFGSFAVSASYNDAKQIRRGFILGASKQFGAFRLAAAVSRDTRNIARKYTNVMLEGRYHLSKRTSIYAAALRRDEGNNYGLGLRHGF